MKAAIAASLAGAEDELTIASNAAAELVRAGKLDEAEQADASDIFHPTRPTVAIPMNWSGNTSKPIRSAEWRSLTKRISTLRSVHPCANYKTTSGKSVPSTKSHPSNAPHESEPAYGLINTTADVLAL
jgi:hypothetical protein